MTSELLYDLPSHLIRRLHQISVAAFVTEAERDGFDLTPVQYAALHALGQNPGVDQATLAGLIAYDKVTMGGVIARLEERGCLSREVSTTDRRSRTLHLTEKGEETVRAIETAVLRAQDVMLRGLSAEERLTFLRLLHKATDAGNTLSRAPLRPVEGQSS